MIAKWKSLPPVLAKVDELRWERTEAVRVEVPSLELTTTIKVPPGVKDITAFLQSSEELKEKVSQAQAQRKETEFELTVEVVK